MLTNHSQIVCRLTTFYFFKKQPIFKRKKASILQCKTNALIF
ncbi:hypothetical protein HMPREF0653_01548 [Prevotella disiens JCM 6334 = ATCC 29426]|uniref:Uncharacterized protein n=1 Tax=Prevotella disiens JCM 6334 = ATCC 29426 TaxID=1235811 RepID=A0ABN0NRP5_9BACT|nr:hypothetical protein HMPREF0653_01548 [Prevotella disiens JCM 6334 = ATCC 29426]